MTNPVSNDIKESLKEFFSSSGYGGQKIIEAFMEEFEQLSFRSPPDDPTNLKNYMDVIKAHIINTLDSSLDITDDNNIHIGIGNDAFLGFEENRTKLKHSPSPVVWVVYLIRGIAGPYAFVNDSMYREKFGYPMPEKYAGGFLIRRDSWNREGWSAVFGSFEQFKHPSIQAFDSKAWGQYPVKGHISCIVQTIGFLILAIFSGLKNPPHTQ
jgi:hypothetical protein